MNDIVFLSGKRTPFGTFLGSLSRFTATDLGEIASKAAIEQAGINASDIDHVIFGNVAVALVWRTSTIVMLIHHKQNLY